MSAQVMEVISGLNKLSEPEHKMTELFPWSRKTHSIESATPPRRRAKSAIKRRLREWTYGKFTTRCKPLVTLENKKVVRLDQKQVKENKWAIKLGWSVTRMMGGKNHGGGETAASSIRRDGVMPWLPRTSYLMFIDYVFANRRSRMNWGVYRPILSALTQPCAAKLIERCFEEKS